MRLKINLLLCGAFVLLCLFFSCKSSKDIVNGRADAQGIDVKHVLTQVSEKNYSYSGLEVNRMNCDVDFLGKQINFKGVMKSQCDQFIDITVSKFIPVARALLSPSEITAVSYLEKGYYQGDYDLLNDLFGVSVDYSFAQSILTGSFAELKDKKLRVSDVSCYKEDDCYVLKWKENKVFGRGFLMTQYVYVNSTSFLIEKFHLVSTIKGGEQLMVNYSDYLELENQQVPTNIYLEALSADGVVKANLQWLKVQFKGEVKNNFSLSEKYQKLN